MARKVLGDPPAVAGNRRARRTAASRALTTCDTLWKFRRVVRRRAGNGGPETTGHPTKRGRKFRDPVRRQRADDAVHRYEDTLEALMQRAGVYDEQVFRFDLSREERPR